MMLMAPIDPAECEGRGGDRRQRHSFSFSSPKMGSEAVVRNAWDLLRRFLPSVLRKVPAR